MQLLEHGGRYAYTWSSSPASLPYARHCSSRSSVLDTRSLRLCMGNLLLLFCYFRSYYHHHVCHMYTLIAASHPCGDILVLCWVSMVGKAPYGQGQSKTSVMPQIKLTSFLTELTIFFFFFCQFIYGFRI